MLRNLPEVNSSNSQTIRIPDQINVAVTARVMRLIDTPQVQRLREISQLGLVSLVYPGAVHSRFEHSLGVYRLACDLLTHLCNVDDRFAEELTETTAKTFLVAALLHDVGHWPYCHPIEDMGLDWVPTHESIARQIIGSGELEVCLNQDWGLSAGQVADFLVPAKESKPGNPADQVLRNVLNGPVDIDKMDYLQRDSHHAGVPYGRNFDLARLIGSLCIDWNAHRLAISGKGKTAAEMLVFARYVMFSEVYWHHAVRGSTAMLQRLVYELQPLLKTQSDTALRWAQQTESEFHRQLIGMVPAGSPLERLCEGLFGSRRQLYKRIGEYSVADSPELHRAFAHRPYDGLLKCSQRLCEVLSRELGTQLAASDVLIDAPPRKLEVQFKLSVRSGGTDQFVPLGNLSPVVKSLATEQFDNFVKQVRVFVAPHIDRTRITADRLSAMMLEIAAA